MTDGHAHADLEVSHCQCPFPSKQKRSGRVRSIDIMKTYQSLQSTVRVVSQVVVELHNSWFEEQQKSAPT